MGYGICVHIELRRRLGLNVSGTVEQEGRGLCTYFTAVPPETNRKISGIVSGVNNTRSMLHIRYHLRTAKQKFKISLSQGRQNVAKKESDI